MTKMASFLLFSAFLWISCTSDKEQKLEDLDKKSAREVTLKTITKGDKVYHITQQNIWIDGQKIAEKTDTITTPLSEKAWGADKASTPMNEIPIYVTVQ